MNFYDRKCDELRKKIVKIDEDIKELEAQKGEIKEEINSYKKEKKSVSSKKKGTPSYVFTKEILNLDIDDEKVKKINDWINEHEANHHPSKYFNTRAYGNPIPIYKVEIGLHPVGRYVTFYCDTCREKYCKDRNFEFNDYETDIEGL